MSHLGSGKPKNDYWKASLSATCNYLVWFLGRRDHWALFFWKLSWSGCFGEWIALSNHDQWIFVARIRIYGCGRCLFATKRRYVPRKWRNHRSFEWKLSRPSDFSKQRLLFFGVACKIKFMLMLLSQFKNSKRRFVPLSTK